jgi:hypothetical protein
MIEFTRTTTATRTTLMALVNVHARARFDGLLCVPFVCLYRSFHLCQEK